MSEYVWLWAELSVPENSIDPWYATRVQGGAWGDWCGLLKDAGTVDPRARLEGVVGEMLDEATKLAKSRSSLFDLRVEHGEIHVRALLSLDDDLEACVKVCVALRGADKFGATGEVLLMGQDGVPNAQIQLAGGSSRCGDVPPETQNRALDELLAAQAAHDQARDAQGSKKKAKRKGARKAT